MSTPDPANQPASPSTSSTAAPRPVAPPPTLAPKPKRSVTGCLGRMLAALLVVLITTIIALAAVAGGASWLGFTPQSANELRAAQIQVATLEARNAALEGQNAAVQTQIAQMIGQAGNDRETLDELRTEVEKFANLSDKVESQLAQDAREQATLVAEMRTSRDSVSLFATTEAGRAATLSELERRSERVERFLQRLSDISGDAALDVQSPTPTAALSTTKAPEPTVAPALTPNTTPTVGPQTTITLPATPSITPTAAATSINTPTPTLVITPTAATPTKKP